MQVLDSYNYLRLALRNLSGVFKANFVAPRNFDFLTANHPQTFQYCATNFWRKNLQENKLQKVFTIFCRVASFGGGCISHVDYIK